MTKNKNRMCLIGRKVGMSQIFDSRDNLVAVTVLEAGPCTVLYKKGYQKGVNVALGYEDKFKGISKGKKVFWDKLEVYPKAFIKEFACGESFGENEVGAIVKADIFAIGDYVDVQSKTKGRGFQGVIKRHNFSRGPETHGSRYHRRPGSMGACADPSRVFKGKKLPGRMGNVARTVQNLKVLSVDADKNILIVKGAIPGPSNGLVYIKSAVKKSK